MHDNNENKVCKENGALTKECIMIIILVSVWMSLIFYRECELVEINGKNQNVHIGIWKYRDV